MTEPDPMPDPLSRLIDAWADTAKKHVELWTSDPTFHRAYTTWIGTLTNLVMGGGKSSSGPIPTKGKVNPKQKPGSTTVTIPAVPTATKLRASAWVDGNRHFIPETLVTLTPDTVAAGQDTEVLVEVMPPNDVPGGSYAGFIVDDASNVLLEGVEVEITPG